MSTIRVSNVSLDSASTSIQYRNDNIIRLVTTGGLKIAAGSNTQRPSAFEAGLFRYNSDTSSIEYSTSTAWVRVERQFIAGTAPTAGDGQNGDVWYIV